MAAAASRSTCQQPFRAAVRGMPATRTGTRKAACRAAPARGPPCVSPRHGRRETEATGTRHASSRSRQIRNDGMSPIRTTASKRPSSNPRRAAASPARSSRPSSHGFSCELASARTGAPTRRQKARASAWSSASGSAPSRTRGRVHHRETALLSRQAGGFGVLGEAGAPADAWQRRRSSVASTHPPRSGSSKHTLTCDGPLHRHEVPVPLRRARGRTTGARRCRKCRAARWSAAPPVPR